MTATLRFPCKIGKVLLPKGSQGIVKGVSNSERIKEAFPHIEHKIDGWYYIVQFPELEDCLLDKSQIDLN